MDTHPSGFGDDEAERLLLARAVAMARAEAGDGMPGDEACAEMLRMIDEINAEIAALLAE
jgi:hypothetical protein